MERGRWRTRALTSCRSRRTDAPWAVTRSLTPCRRRSCGRWGSPGDPCTGRPTGQRGTCTGQRGTCTGQRGTCTGEEFLVECASYLISFGGNIQVLVKRWVELSLLSRKGKIKHQRLLRLTLLASALLSINLFLKLEVLFTIGSVASGIFQIANIVPSLIK